MNPKKLFLTVGFFCLSLQAQATTTHEIIDLLKPLQEKASVALIITDLNQTQTPLLSLQPQLFLMPASIQKILTSIVATTSLDATAPFQTSMRAYGQQQNDLLTGKIILETGANPNFDTQALNTLVQTIKQRKVRKIQGPLYILKTHFDDIEKTPGTTWDEVDDCYATATSDISMNQNCFMLGMVRLGQKIIPYTPQKDQPIHLNIKLDNACNDLKGALSHFPAYGHGALLKQNPFTLPDTLEGCWNPSRRSLALKRSIHDPTTSLKNNLQQALEDAQIELTGNIHVLNHEPSITEKPLWKITIPSQNRQQLIQTMLVKSHNHIANQLFKEAAFQKTGQRSSWETAQSHAQNILEHYQLQDPDASIVDGAGLSRNNRLNAAQIQKSLIKIYQTNELQHLLHLFPNQKTKNHPLSKRFASLKTPIFAKTGSLKNVISLAGYIDPLGTHPKAFTLIINGHKDIHKTYLPIEADLFKKISKIQTSAFEK